MQDRHSRPVSYLRSFRLILLIFHNGVNPMSPGLKRGGMIIDGASYSIR
jgi:hypothetical protein